MSNRRYKDVKTSEEIPTIVVESPSDSNIQFIDDDSKNIDSNKSTNGNNTEEVAGKSTSSGTGERASLRRNSISLPNLDDLSVLKEKITDLEAKNADFSNDENESSSSEEDEEIPNIRTPLRNARRKSVISPRMLRPPGDEESGSNSPANSVTSVNSLASLLREKIQALPQTFRKKKSPDYKTRIFVAILFCTVVVLILTAYFLYHQKVLQRAYFEKIKFNKVKRVMKIFNNEGQEIINARLGTTINYEKVFPCLPGDTRKDGSICLEWMARARLYLHYYHLQDNLKCYNLNWIALSDHIAPTDCFDLATGGHWYGGGQTSESAWPLEKGFHKFAPFITGHVEHHQWGNVMKRYFINSKGAAIIIDNSSPLYVSIQGKEKKEMCLRGQYDDFGFVNRKTVTPHLNYSICTHSNSSSMAKLHSDLSEKNLWDGMSEKDVEVMKYLLAEPLWEISPKNKNNLTEETINLMASEIDLGVLKQGHVLINEFWQKEVGDFEVDVERFPTLNTTIDMLHRRGFRIVFTIQPFISTESINFREAVQKRLLITERHAFKKIPALTKYKTVESAGVLDMTNNRTVAWLLQKLKNVVAKYKVNSYYLDLGIAYDMPFYYQSEKPLINPDAYKTYFTRALQGSVSVFGVSSAVERPKMPAFVSLPSFESSWSGLRRVIPTILTYGVLGYPHLIPGAFGGDYDPPKTFKFGNKTESPSKELFIRWLQLATFLPVVRYNHLPSKYEEMKLLEVVKNMAVIRITKVKPLLEQFASQALHSGLPIIRPLWMLDSSDPACHNVVDEFSVGNDLIVAPVLYPGARQREVYLPAGVWKDGIDGTLRKGSRWIHDYRVEENQIAYFERKPDDTRF